MDRNGDFNTPQEVIEGLGALQELQDMNVRREHKTLVGKPKPTKGKRLTPEQEKALCKQYGFRNPAELYERYPHLTPTRKRR